MLTFVDPVRTLHKQYNSTSHIQYVYCLPSIHKNSYMHTTLTVGYLKLVDLCKLYFIVTEGSRLVSGIYKHLFQYYTYDLSHIQVLYLQETLIYTVLNTIIIFSATKSTGYLKSGLQPGQFTPLLVHPFTPEFEPLFDHY